MRRCTPAVTPPGATQQSISMPLRQWSAFSMNSRTKPALSAASIIDIASRGDTSNTLLRISDGHQLLLSQSLAAALIGDTRTALRPSAICMSMVRPITTPPRYARERYQEVRAPPKSSPAQRGPVARRTFRRLALNSLAAKPLSSIKRLPRVEQRARIPSLRIMLGPCSISA
jgi:hypothetical protein